jgi:hypothetical protein
MRLCRCVEVWVHSRDKTYLGGVPFFFCPLMLGEETLMVSQDALNRWDGFNLVDAGLGENSMENKIRRFPMVIATSGFLMHIELTLMNQWITPFEKVDCVDLTIAIVVNDYFFAKRFLNGLHPVCVDNAWSYHLLLTRLRYYESELEDFRRHFWVVFLLCASPWWDCGRDIVETIWIVLSGFAIAMKRL